MRAIVDNGPDPEVDGVVRWRCVDLRGFIQKRFGVDLDEVSIGRLLKERLCAVRARAIPSKTKTRSRLLKTFPDHVAEIVNKLPADTAVELWFQML